MPKAPLKGVIPSEICTIKKRALSNYETDKSAVTAMVQAAVNVEMFTLPLYMCSMSSIQGTHEINSKGTSFYKGRVWPGMATTAGATLTANQQAYNTIFSVFIQEMLHLQLAANLAAVLGVTPKFFNGTVLENKTGGWGCYGKNNTVIPHIIDLQDTTTFQSVKVNLDVLDADQIKLFLAIEQSHDAALNDIKPKALKKYFPSVPFAGWKANNTEADLPLFGTIGWMYYSLLHYLAIEYTDGELLWEKMTQGNLSVPGQRDLFNAKSPSHQAEYPRMPTKVSVDPLLALLQAVDIVLGICDQGEGGIGSVVQGFRQAFLKRHADKHKGTTTNNNVLPAYQPSKQALEADYPSYNADGKPTGGSADADARSTGDKTDHWARFNSLSKVIKQKDFMTWPAWFKKNKGGWKAADLKTAGYKPNPKIPSPDQVAAALNELKSSSKADLSKVVVGAIAGINNVLTNSWGDASVSFPFPAMAGSGDRMSFYWAVFGEAPDLSVGEASPSSNLLYHACQGLAFEQSGVNCAAPSVYHTCAGSNSCKAQGGCGFVQPVTGGSSCGSSCGGKKATPKTGNSCGQPSQKYTAPSDNKCGSFGGCAVPISASQLYPKSGTMVLDDVIGGASGPLNDINFKLGDSVYDTAWNAYSQVMKSNGQDPGDKPKPNALRTALPPST